MCTMPVHYHSGKRKTRYLRDVGIQICFTQSSKKFKIGIPCNLIFRLNNDPSPDMFNIFNWIVENAQWNNFISASVHLWPIVYSNIVETYSMHGKKFPYAVFLLKFVHAKQDNNWMKERIGSTWVFAAVQL